MKKFCSECGNQMGASESFCGKCGTSAGATPDTSTRPLPTEEITGSHQQVQHDSAHYEPAYEDADEAAPAEKKSNKALLYGLGGLGVAALAGGGAYLGMHAANKDASPTADAAHASSKPAETSAEPNPAKTVKETEVRVTETVNAPAQPTPAAATVEGAAPQAPAKKQFNSAGPNKYAGPDTLNNGYFNFTLPVGWTADMTDPTAMVLTNSAGKRFDLSIQPSNTSNSLDITSSCSTPTKYGTLEYSDTLAGIGNPNGYPTGVSPASSNDLSPRTVLRLIDVGGNAGKFDMSATDHKMGPNGETFCSNDTDAQSFIRTSSGRIKFSIQPGEIPTSSNQSETASIQSQLMSDGTYSGFNTVANSIKLGNDPSLNPKS